MPLDTNTTDDHPDSTTDANGLTTHKVHCREIDFNASGHVYRVTHRGEVLIARAWESITEAARILIARGYDPHSRIELWGGEPYYRLRGRLGHVATLTVIESANVSVKWAPYEPHPRINR